MVTDASNGIYQQLINAGVEVSNHESDLYAPVNDITREIIKNYRFRDNVRTFVSNVDKKLWYDIPFAYVPYWVSKNGV